MAKKWTTERTDAEACFKHFAKIMHRQTTRRKQPAGAWRLSCVDKYGCAIERVYRVGRVDYPFGDRRRPPREFCETLRFATDAVIDRLYAQKQAYERQGAVTPYPRLGKRRRR